MVPTPRGGRRPAGGAPAGRTLGAWAAAVLLALAIAACGSSPSRSPSPSPSGGAWRQHTDAQAGFVIQYPDAWNVYRPTSPGVQFLAGPDGSDFVEVRVTPNLPVNFNGVSSQVTKKLIDDLLAGQAINIVSTTEVTYSGLRGWQYVYTFTDPKLGTGVHVHVFLFQGNRLQTLVFQALPSSRLKALAPTFDQILARYRALPLPSAAASPSASPSGSSSPSPVTSPSASP